MFTGFLEHSSISKIFQRHKTKTDNIQKQTAQKRKDYINQYCSEYGNLYKQLKKQFHSFVSSKREKINSLEKNTTITYIDLSVNDIGNNTEIFKALAKMLESNKSIKYL